MPALANLTVKKNDGTTDVVYTGTSPGSGDSPAVHYGPALGATAATRPELRTTAKRHADGSGYTVKGTFMYPFHVLNSTTGVTSVVKRAMAKAEFTSSTEIPTATNDEAVSQSVNLFASAWKQACKDGATFT